MWLLQKKVCILIFLIFGACLYAQNNSNTGTYSISDTFFGDVYGVGNDYVGVWNDVSWPNAGIATLAIGGSFALGLLVDKPVDDFFAQNIRGKADYIFGTRDFFLNSYGTEIGAGLMGLGYLSGLLFNVSDLRIMSRLMLEALVPDYLVTLGGKIIIGRHRPFVGDEPYTFSPFSFNSSYNSMPSGHATMAFVAATVFASYYDQWWSYTVGYTLASAIAFSRIYSDEHWTSDVLVGAALGTLSALAVVKAYKSGKKDDAVALLISPTSVTVKFSY